MYARPTPKTTAQNGAPIFKMGWSATVTINAVKAPIDRRPENAVRNADRKTSNIASPPTKPIKASGKLSSRLLTKIYFSIGKGLLCV